MRKGATILVVLALLGCPEPELNQVNVYNWMYYIPEDVLADFTKETGITINYEEYDSNETMLAKLTAGASFDVVFPSGDFVAHMVAEGLVQPIDLSKVPNFANVDASIVRISQTFDPGNRYSVPFNMGATGIVYWKDKVQNPGDSYAILSRPDLKGRTAILDDTREVCGAALAALGFSANSINPLEISKATDLILTWKGIALMFDNERMPALFANREIWVAMNYPENLFAHIAEDRLANVGFFMPKEGGVSYLDNMVLLKNSKNLENAYVFMNYILRADILARITDEHGFPGISSKANALRKAPARITMEDLAKREVKLPLYDAKEFYTRAWEERIMTAE